MMNTHVQIFNCFMTLRKLMYIATEFNQFLNCYLRLSIKYFDLYKCIKISNKSMLSSRKSVRPIVFTILTLSSFPVGIWRQNDVVLTSMRHNRIIVYTTSCLRHVPAGL